MSTGNINLDILLNQILNDAMAGTKESMDAIRKRYPNLTEKEAREIIFMIAAAAKSCDDRAELVVTAPPSFALKTKSTKITVDSMLANAKRSILITGYSLSNYFSGLIDCIVKKTQEGVLVKFFLNDIENQRCVSRLLQYQGRFMEIYNYSKKKDSMSALHAKVISVDQKETLITSANLSYHGQEGNVEVGIHVTSNDIAIKMEQMFAQLIFSRVFKRINR